MSDKNIMIRKKRSKIKKLLSLGLSSCLVMGLLCGCGEKTVDYSVDTEQPAETATGSLAQFAEAERWIDKWTIPMADGDEFSMSVNAKVTIPDTDAMYVVEVEETVLDAKWKQQLCSHMAIKRQVAGILLSSGAGECHRRKCDSY